MAGNGTQKPKTINAVHLTSQILGALAEMNGAGVTELAKEVGTTKATVCNHLATLCEEDFVVKQEDGQYYVGLRFIDMAHCAKSRLKIHDLVQAEVDSLAEETGEMTLFKVEEHGKEVCLYKSCGEKAVQTDLYVGKRAELHHTAVGKAILAHLPEERRAEILDQHELTEVTSSTITNSDELRAELEEVRQRGVAFNYEEAIPGLVGVGVPIMMPDGDVGGAISVIGPARRMDEEYLQDELADRIMRSANIIEINARSV